MFRSLILVYTLSICFSQQVIFQSDLIKREKSLLDAGIGWNSYSLLGYDWNQNISSYNKFSTYVLKNKIILQKHSLYKNNFFISIAPEFRFTSNKQLFMIKSSSLGFQNRWAKVQIKKGKEDWGAGSDISLALSEDSKNYNYLMIASNYGFLRVKYIHGFLEKINKDVNRYITGKGLEWTNKKSFILSLSEVVIYSGFNRNLEISYLNPMSSHLEIELNNRLSQIGDGDANAVWQFNSDFFLKNKIRLSFNFLFDEFVIDQIQRDMGKEDGKAASFRISYLLYNNNKSYLNIYSSHIYVGTPTFRHGSGINNFVTSNKPLGWKYGSDGTQTSLGLKYFDKNSILLNLEIFNLKIGEESLTKRSYEKYENYLKGSFPSGDTISKTMIKADFQLSLFNNLTLFNILEFAFPKTQDYNSLFGFIFSF